VAAGRGSISTGPLYFEHVSRGPILVRSDDVDRLLALLQQCYRPMTETTGDGLAGPGNKGIQTSKRCREWLERLMGIRKPPKLAKRFYQKRAQRTFKVSGRAFDREWAKAIAATGADAWGWGKAGTKPRRKSKH
jgi:hypothetical protein